MSRGIALAHDSTIVDTVDIAPEHRLQKEASPAPLEVGDLIVAYLEQLGVEYVFGIPGGAIEPLYNALARSARRGGPRAIVARHEAGAAFMADGYARETGRLGVCIATSGPGATNLITGIACAHDNNVPMLAITGLPVLPSFGKGALQESSGSGVNTLAMFRHCTRYNSLVSHADQIERKLANALLTAHQNPAGPAHLAIPLDILRAPVKHQQPSFELAKLLGQKASLIDEGAVQVLKTELQRAPRVVFVIGTACGEAIAAIMALIETTHARFVTTPDAKGLIDPHHAAYCGVFGFGGHSSAQTLLSSEPDLVLALGAGFSEFVSGGWCDALLNKRLIHIDNSEENLIRTPMARLHVRGRIVAVCERLLELLGKDGRDSGGSGDGAANVYPLHPPPNDADDAGVILQAPESYRSDATPIKPQRLMKELSERCPPDTRFLADSGNSMTWTTHYLQPRQRLAERASADAADAADADAGLVGRPAGTNWLRVMMDFCPMGWAIGAAIGVARGNPQSPVVCITGDGAYLMSGQEITVAAAEQLTVVFVVLNDAALGMVKHGQRLARAEPIGFALPSVDYRKLAEAMGIPGHVIESPADFARLDFEQIFTRQGPTMIDVRIDPEEVPPMIVRMKTLGTMQ